MGVLFEIHWLSFEQGLVSNILEEDVVQPLLVSTSAIELATETVSLLLKIDDCEYDMSSYLPKLIVSATRCDGPMIHLLPLLLDIVGSRVKVYLSCGTFY